MTQPCIINTCQKSQHTTSVFTLIVNTMNIANTMSCIIKSIIIKSTTQRVLMSKIYHLKLRITSEPQFGAILSAHVICHSYIERHIVCHAQFRCTCDDYIVYTADCEWFGTSNVHLSQSMCC